MIVQLERVVFDHAPGVAQTDALSIRTDRVTPAPVWTFGALGRAPAAYALNATRGRQLTIAADFSFPPPFGPPAPGELRVRAEPADPNAAILGSVAPTDVPPPQAGAATTSVKSSLSNVRIWQKGVGVYPFTWRWQFQLRGGAWTDFERTDHTIYVTLDVPGAPWTQATGVADQPLWPWTLVLDWACEWARGVKVNATNLDAARKKLATNVEGGIYALGQRDDTPLTYHESGAADYAPNSLGTVFFCTDFLALLAGKPVAGKTEQVNCSDCAAALVTFANAAGCTLQQQKASSSTVARFRSNPILPIGRAAGDFSPFFFAFHEFAVRTPATSGAPQVHDACMKIDRDPQPAITDTHHRFDLAHGLGLGALGASTSTPATLKYAHRLIKPGHWATAKLTASVVRSLDVAPGPALAPDAVVLALHAFYRDEIDRLAPTRVAGTPNAPLEPIPIEGFQLYEVIAGPSHWGALPYRIPRSAEFFYVASDARFDRASPKNRAAPDRRLRIAVGYAQSPANARDALAWVLADSQSPTSVLATANRAAIGDAAFAGPTNSAAFFVRGNAIVRLVNAGRVRLRVEPLARAVDVAIQRAGVREPEPTPAVRAARQHHDRARPPAKKP